MIRENTVFVLGAGASMPFGLPSGRQLQDEVISQILNPPRKSGFLPAISATFYNDGRRPKFSGGDWPKNENSVIKGLFKVLKACGFEEMEIKDFAIRLRGSQFESIDRFLESAPEFSDMGKIAIAHEILHFEDSERLFADTNWYRYLWQVLTESASAENFRDNKVTFITFNYDRSLELFFSHAYRHVYNVPEHVANEIVAGMDIIHVHGKVGQLGDKENSIEYGHSNPTPDQLIKLAGSIKVIHEDIDGERSFINAHSRITQAHRIFFLGFGFHSKNVERLRLSRIVQSRTQCFATRKGLTDLKCGIVKSQCPNILFDRVPGIDDSLELLENTLAPE